MPISSTPGITGVVQNPGAPPTANPLEGFAQQLFEAKQKQKEAAMMDLDSAMKLAQYDPAAAEKIGAPALKALYSHATGSAGGGTESIFKEIYKKSTEQADLSKRQAEAGIAASTAQTGEANAGATLRTNQANDLQYETEKKQHIDTARTAYLDESKSPEIRSQALSALHLLGGVTDEQFANAEVRLKLTPEQTSHMFDNLARKIAGDKTEEELNTSAAGLVSSLAANNYGGDTAKATIAANAIVRGQTPPAADLTDKNIDRAAKIGSFGVQMGWPQTLIRQAITLGTTDLDKIGEAAGWSPAQRKIVDNLIPLETRRVTAEEKTAEAANAQRMGAAFKDYMEGLHADDANKRLQMEAMGKLVNQWHDLSATKTPKDPALQAIQKELTTQLGANLGLSPTEVPGWLSIFGDYFNTSTLARPGDTQAIDGEGGPTSTLKPVGMPTAGVSSFLQPEVLAEIPSQMMTTGLTAVGSSMTAAGRGIAKVPSAVEDYLKTLSASEYERQKKEAAKKK